jgi:AraC-like DNA-binding protein
MVEDIIIYTPMFVTFFWSIVLLSSRRDNNRAKFFLGIFMFTAFLLYLSHAHFFQKVESVYQYFNSVYNFASLAVYPLFFWYVRLLTIETDYKPVNLLHLIPAVIFGSSTLAVYLLMSPEELKNYFHHLMNRNVPDETFTSLMKIQNTIYNVSRVVFLIQVIFYLIRGQNLVRRYNKRIANFYSNLENRSIVWVNVLFYSLVITSAMSIIFNLIGRSVFINSVGLLMIPSFIFSTLMFIIGMEGLMQNHTVAEIETDEKEVPEILLKNENSAKLKEKLLDLFANDTVYKNSELKITDVSEKLNTNRTYISKLINTDFSCTFSEFVNRYRVVEAKKLLSEESSKNYSLDYISEKAGFGSMVNFMRVFKEFEGTTPGKFRESVLKGK